MTDPWEVEFKVGDTVTFTPYETGFKVKVKAIRTEQMHCDHRTFYELSSDRVKTVTTGQCIKESKYFKPNSINNIWKE